MGALGIPEILVLLVMLAIYVVIVPAVLSVSSKSKFPAPLLATEICKIADSWTCRPLTRELPVRPPAIGPVIAFWVRKGWPNCCSMSITLRKGVNPELLT